jgi:predicted Zn-dependent protease with MMP-like domain
MTQERFVKLVTEVLDSLPDEFRNRIQNLAVIVEEQPPQSKRPRRSVGKSGSVKTHRLVLGEFQGLPATQRSMFDLSSGPDRIILYKKNIEASCRSEDEVRHEVRQTVLHELGHYFGMSEGQLRHV